MPTCTYDDLQNFITYYESYDKLFYKSLSTNDHAWTYGKGNQSGPLIPKEYFEFFTGLKEFPKTNKTYELDVDWLFEDEEKKRSDLYDRDDWKTTTLKYYFEGVRKKEKRPGLRITNVYKPYFKNLNDGSYFIVGRIPISENEYKFKSIIIDDDDLYDIFLNNFNIPEGSTWDTISFKDVIDFDNISPSKLELYNILQKKADDLFNRINKIPSTEITSNIVWDVLKNNQDLLKGEINYPGPGIYNSKDTIGTVLKNIPGNFIRFMLENAEFYFVKEFEKYIYPDVFVDHLKEYNFPANWEELEYIIGKNMEEMINISTSLTNSRRSRAGYSFQWHIVKLLKNYKVDFEREVSEKKIDFQITYGDNKTINLAAKTTLRERWKQVYKDSYFMTLDRNISKTKMKNIKKRNIKLVVPEEDKEELEEYKENDDIITYKDFIKIIDV